MAKKKSSIKRAKSSHCTSNACMIKSKSFLTYALSVFVIGIALGFLLGGGFDSTGRAIGDVEDELSVVDIPDFCDDGDGGVKLTVQTTVSGVKDGEEFTKTDMCTDTTNIIEYYCQDNEWYAKDYNCDHIGSRLGQCQDGRCI